VLISNLHCPTCSSNISEILSRLFPRPQLVSTSIVKQTVTVTHGPELLPREIVKTLLDAEFEVDSVALSEGNHPVDSFSPVGNEAIPVFSEARGWLEEARMLVGRFMQSNQGKLHLDICAVCRQVVSDNALPGNLVSSLPGDNSAASPLGEKRSVVNIQTEGLSTWEVSISIGGMTCTSCTGSIAKKLEELAWVKEVVINLMSNSGLVKFESATGKQEADALVNAIEDMGFDATLNSLKNLEEKACTGGPSSIVRKVSLIVKGMYCHRCPEKILSTLETSFPDIISIEVAPSVREPVITMLYRPSPHITIRKILEVLSDIEPVFQVSVFHPPTIEERSKKIQLKERNTYLRHWVLCIICAIPTFLIGIVWMALVPTTDPIRMFMEEPIWAGKVSRFEWVLFILSTPVMFYAAGPFHKKAILEIVSLWRPGNSAPILRRFLRFGSMNLLISLGVSISYFASIAMLAMQAVKDRHSVLSNKHVTTYFDSTVFLTMFLLMGNIKTSFEITRNANINYRPIS
jgi:Cu+-exporting ATPase